MLAMATRMRKRSGPLADTLRDGIRSGRHLPGTPIPSLTQLQRETGYSPTTIRRAIRVLADEGWVSVQPGKGTFVQPPESWPQE